MRVTVETAAYVVAFSLAVVVPFATLQDDLQSRENNPWAIRAHALEGQVLELQAEILQREIALSNCVATTEDRDHKLESYRYNERVGKLLADYAQQFGGEWIWDKDTNRPVRKQEKPR